MLNKLALNVPGISGDTNIPNPEGLQFSGPAQTSLGYVLSQFLNLFFTLAIVLSFLYFVWGAYEYIIAQGQKEALNNAKERIRYSLVGFILIVIAFLISNWAPSIFPFIRSFYDNANVPVIQDTGNIQTPPCESGKPC
jgi:ABC-type Fe3+ transport system permease subunit